MRVDGLFYDNSIPFSCCDRDALRPCIHESVTSSDAHFAYDVAHDLTIYTKGCAVVLAQIIADNILGRLGSFGLMLLIVEVRSGSSLQTIYSANTNFVSECTDYCLFVTLFTLVCRGLRIN